MPAMARGNAFPMPVVRILRKGGTSRVDVPLVFANLPILPFDQISAQIYHSS
jgi:hypothetical protein